MCTDLPVPITGTNRTQVKPAKLSWLGGMGRAGGMQNGAEKAGNGRSGGRPTHGGVELGS